MENKKITKKQAEELTKKLRTTIKDFFNDSEITPTMFNCDKYESPSFYPRISVIQDNKRVAIIEINFR
jgi:hypothetical protein